MIKAKFSSTNGIQLDSHFSLAISFIFRSSNHLHCYNDWKVWTPLYKINPVDYVYICQQWGTAGNCSIMLAHGASLQIYQHVKYIYKIHFHKLNLSLHCLPAWSMCSVCLSELENQKLHAILSHPVRMLKIKAASVAGRILLLWILCCLMLCFSCVWQIRHAEWIHTINDLKIYKFLLHSLVYEEKKKNHCMPSTLLSVVKVLFRNL